MPHAIATSTRTQKRTKKKDDYKPQRGLVGKQGQRQQQLAVTEGRSSGAATLSGRQREIGQRRVRGDATGGSAHSPLSNRGRVFAKRRRDRARTAQSRPDPSLTLGGRGGKTNKGREERAMAACGESGVICMKATRELLAVELSLCSPDK